VMLQKIFKTKLRKIPSGAENSTIKIKRKIKPNCSKIILVSVLIGNIEKRSLDPSSGGMGIKLKKAKRVFQNTIIIKISKKIALNEPEITEEIVPQLLKLVIISTLSATGSAINLAAMAKIRAINMLEAGPAKATMAGPHF
jgi:hypothetical protein